MWIMGDSVKYSVYSSILDCHFQFNMNTQSKENKILEIEFYDLQIWETV